jgi:hypothetical protein
MRSAPGSEFGHRLTASADWQNVAAATRSRDSRALVESQSPHLCFSEDSCVSHSAP